MSHSWEEIRQTLWIAAASSMCGASCAVLGCFLLLKRMSMLTDGIAHGVLPGIALAMLLTGQVSGFPLLVGALLFGLLTAALTQAVVSFGGVSEDAGLGVVFTSLFALGVILISTTLRHLDADVDCVFSGLLAGVPTRTWFVGSFEIPKAIPTLTLALAATSVAVALLWKEWKLATFDAELASAMGFRPVLLHFVLVALAATNAVASFEAVGSILVVPMFVVPAATARLLTERLERMVAAAACLAVSGAVVGSVLATLVWKSINAPGLIAAVLGAQFVAAWIVAPGQGLWPQFLRRVQLAIRIAEEEVLGKLFRSPRTLSDLASVVREEHGIGRWGLLWVVRRLRRCGFVESTEGVWRVTAAGRSHAAEIVRAHRLWEAYLDSNFELPRDHLHASASMVEHYLGPEAVQAIEEELAHPRRDPHGSEIPRSGAAEDPAPR